MEDRYLFKAKRLDNGEWEIGNLITNVFFRLGQSIPYILCSDKAEYDCFEDFTEENGIFEVRPDTICQCTGLKDKNGNLIWENDVVRVTINSGSTICRCAFADTVAQFQLWQKHTIKRTSTVLNLGNYECEVIGNIFDNPELLEK